MRHVKACFFLLFLISNYSFSQNITIKGSVLDTSEQKSLVNSVIAVLRKSDSVLVSFSRSDRSGNFALHQIPPGKAIIMVTHPTYADYVDHIEIKDSLIDLGKIFMTLKSQLLQEVVVSQTKGAIRIMGDTVEYKADSFYMRAGATVEELLKKLPGIQVDKDGKITAQGESVQKVLIDGEEFFSDDPTIVTQNILADAVDKVQVYDKKSDQAAFTGIDDGQKTKTIDLKLKDNRKKGYFGKVELGTDGKKYWNNSGMLNAFKGKRKLSLFGITSNTGRTGLDWNEAMNYSGSSIMENVTEDGGGVYLTMNSDEFDRSSIYGEGLPKGWNGGIHYGNKWNNDKIGLNGNYQYKKLNTEARGTTQSQYILPDTLYYVNESGNTYSSKYRNRIDGSYEVQLDSLSSIKIVAQGSSGHSSNLSDYYTESLDKSGSMVNSSNRRISAEVDTKNFNSNLLFRKKFKKQGRTISLNSRQVYSDNQSDGFLLSDSKFFEAGYMTTTVATDQQKLNNSKVLSVNAKVTYTEPLSKKAILEFSYSIANNHSESRRTTMEKMNGIGKYEAQVDSLSNDYDFNVLTNAAGINYRYSKPKKINFSFGGSISRADFTRKDLNAVTSTSYNFTNIFPQATVNYTLGSAGNLNFSYFGSTQAPSIEQIQPINDNTDPLHQRIGNPNLKQAFRQRFNLSYNSYKLLSQRSFYSTLHFSTVNNDFSNVNFVDTLGRRISQPVNVQGNYYAYFYFNYSKMIRKVFRLSLYSNMNKTHNTNFINGLKNINNSFNVSAGPRFSVEKEKKYELSLSPRITWNTSESSIRPDITTKYITQEHNAYFLLFLPWKLEFNTDCTFSLRQKTDAFDKNTNSIRWNARLDKKFLKNDAGILRLAAFDILDQNLGFQRTINSNFVSEKTYDTFRRYLLISLIWNFSKNGKPQSW